MSRVSSTNIALDKGGGWVDGGLLDLSSVYDECLRTEEEEEKNAAQATSRSAWKGSVVRRCF